MPSWFRRWWRWPKADPYAFDKALMDQLFAEIAELDLVTDADRDLFEAYVFAISRHTVRQLTADLARVIVDTAKARHRLEALLSAQ